MSRQLVIPLGIIALAAYVAFDVLLAIPRCRQGEWLWCSMVITMSVERRHDP